MGFRGRASEVINFQLPRNNFRAFEAFCESALGWGDSYMAEHGNRPNFATENENARCILADFGKQNYFRKQKFYVFKGGIRHNSNLTDNVIL